MMQKIIRERQLSEDIRIIYREDPEKSYPGDDFIIAENWEWGVYFYESWDIKDFDVIIDIGAHIGAFALYCASQNQNAKIFAYEPNPENYGLLELNIQHNNLGENIIPVRKAVDAHHCRRRFYIDARSHAGHSLIKKSAKWNIVSCITMESLFTTHHLVKCDLLKLDCEGSEKDIILNLSPEILSKIHKISLEYHFKIFPPETLFSLIAKLEQANFRVVFRDDQKPFLPILLQKV